MERNNMQSKSKECDDNAPAEGGSPLNEHLPPVTLPPFDADTLRHPRKKPKVKESIVDHTYRDYSTIEVPCDEKEGKGAKKANPNFPEKLHGILSHPHYSHIIRWQPHGRSWKVVDKHLLTTIILPEHFSHGNFESFTRSVNGWGFKRLLSDGPDKKTYYHECFLRGRPDLTSLVQRLNNPGKRLPDKSGEPDFYEISRKYPLPLAAPPASPSGISHGQNLPLASPKNVRSSGLLPVMFPSPLHTQANGYANPFPQPNSPHAQMQQMYWPNPGASPMLYGYYPYPPMMMAPQPGMQQPGMMQAGPHGMMMAPQPGMMQAGPQGMMMAPQPGMHLPGMMQAGLQGMMMASQPGMQQPGMMQAGPQGYYWVPPYHPSAAQYLPTATPDATPAGTAAPATMPGQTVENAATSDTAGIKGGADEVTPTAPSATETAATVIEKSPTGESQDMKPGGADEVTPAAPSATEAAATVREKSPTWESQETKAAAQTESNEEHDEEEKIAEV